MAVRQWDPLATSLTSEVVQTTIKRQIKNILKSYTGWFDPIAELLQNALDAVDARKIKKEKDFKPKIWIKIDLKEDIICVTDNGIGFSADEFKNFLAPNVSFKKEDNRGNKGVGATYLAYGFNFLQIGTKSKDFQFFGTITGGREWVEDESGTKIRPKIVQDKAALHDIFQQIDRGSSFCLKLVGDYIRPKNFSWVNASTADQWEIILRAKTPLGGIYFNKSYESPSCTLLVIDDKGNKTEKVISDCEYLYPHKVISSCMELDNIRNIQQELINKGKDGSKLPDSCYKLNGLFNYWNHTDLGSREFTGFSDEEKLLAAKHQVSFYGFFGYSTDIWDTYNDDVAKLRKGARILKGGLQIATNYMPQGDLQQIRLTKNIGLQNVTHVVVHFEGADPDLGRKGFQPELEALAHHIATSIVRAFTEWRKLLKKETGAPPDITAQKAVHDWIKEQEEHEKNYPLIITRKDVFLPTMEPALTSNPLNEQDVVSLFNQLLAGGVVRGIKILSTSSHQTYDGICKFFIKDPLEHYVFNKETNPLGLQAASVKPYLSAPMILEYKYSIDGLLEEIEKGDKTEKHIHLVIAWITGKEWEKKYDVTSLLDLSNLHHRYFHGETHIFKNSISGERVFSAVILSELINYLNDPDAVQQYHKTKYGK